MIRDRCDARTRIHIESSTDGAEWKRHPAGQGKPAASPGAALDAALAEMGIEEAVIILNGRQPPP